jgi:regulator of sigma E protease
MSSLGVLVLLGLLIVIHEAGHLAAARLVGIPIAGFSVGFGPKLWQRRWGQVEYCLRWLPLGGFVTPALDGPEFSRIPLRRRLVFFLGGPLANLAASLPLLAALNVAEQGASFYNLFVAPFAQVARGCWQLLVLLAGVHSHPEAVSGLVGILVQGSRVVDAGLTLDLAISLSLSLAVLNLLPIPMLDGGQITMSCLEEAFPRMTRLRVPLTVLGLIFLAVLMVYANVQDVVRYWGS